MGSPHKEIEDENMTPSTLKSKTSNIQTTLQQMGVILQQLKQENTQLKLILDRHQQQHKGTQ